MCEIWEAKINAYKLAFLGGENGNISRARHMSSTGSKPRVCLHTIQSQTMLKPKDLSRGAKIDDCGGGVLVVENVDLEWIAVLGIAFQIDLAFFVEHATNPQGSPWNAVFGKWSADHRKPVSRRMPPDSLMAERESWHIDGVIEFESPQQQPSLGETNSLPRVMAYEKQNGWQVTTRISYCLLTPHLYLILVDAPVVRTSSSSNPGLVSQRPQLRVPLGLNRGGLVLPYLLDEAVPSFFGCLRGFFSHPWHFHVLFAKEPGFHIHLSPETIFHLIATSTWETNLRILQRRIKHISFDGIRRPSIRTTDALHDERRDLRFILEQVAVSLKWMPPQVRSELEAVKDRLPAAKYIGYPDAIQTELLESAFQLEKFLMDTFNLLLSTINVLEAESTREQATRGQMLTRMATVYGAVSFVTGVFGMNVREINGSPLSMWVVITMLVVVGCCTGAVFASQNLWRAFRRVVGVWY